MQVIQAKLARYPKLDWSPCRMNLRPPPSPLGSGSIPHKEMVLFEDAGHFAVWSMPNKFLQELNARVRSLAVQP